MNPALRAVLINQAARAPLTKASAPASGVNAFRQDGYVWLNGERHKIVMQQTRSGEAPRELLIADPIKAAPRAPSPLQRALNVSARRYDPLPPSTAERKAAKHAKKAMKALPA